MTMLKVFDPARASLEFILGNPEDLGDVPGLVTDQRIGEGDVLRDRCGGQPINKLTLDLWELGRSELREDQRWAIVGLTRGVSKGTCVSQLSFLLRLERSSTFVCASRFC